MSAKLIYLVLFVYFVYIMEEDIKIDLDNIIGVGFNKVYKGLYKRQPAAIKILKHDSLVTNEDSILARLDHPFIIKCLGRIIAPYYLRIRVPNSLEVLVFEYVEGVRLSDLPKPYPLNFLFMVMNQLIDTMEYIHSKHIVHGDLHYDNILLTEDLHIVLLDFGNAVDYSKHPFLYDFHMMRNKDLDSCVFLAMELHPNLNLRMNYTEPSYHILRNMFLSLYQN